MKLVNKTVDWYPMFGLDELIKNRTEAQVWWDAADLFEYQVGDQFSPIIEEHLREVS